MLHAQFSYNKKQVLFLTGMNEQYLKNFQYATAIDWLEFYYGKSIECEKLLSVPAFINWFIHHWLIRDEDWIVELLYSMPPSQRLYQYRAFHQNIFSDSEDGNRLRLDFNNMYQTFQQAIKALQKQPA